VPDDHALVSIVALGHAAEDRNPDKRPLSEVLRWNRY